LDFPSGEKSCQSDLAPAGLNLLKFLQTYEVSIYVLLGAVAILYFRKLLIAWQSWRMALFGMEREIAQRRLSAALTIVALLVLMAGAEFTLVTVVAPMVPQANGLATPTLNLLITATVTLGPKQTPQPGSVPTAVPLAAVVSNGCMPGKLEWTFPKNGDEIGGTIELKGTVNVDNLGFYKYEFSQPNSDSWVTIAAGNQAKTDAALGGAWNTTVLTPGDYLLRLVVSDNQNNPLPSCQIAVRVVSK
jgi:hypothetical protein